MSFERMKKFRLKLTLIMESVMGLGPFDENPAMTGDGLIPNSVFTCVMKAMGVLVSFRDHIK